MVLKMWKSSVKEYFRKVWNVVDLLIVLMSLAMVILFFERNKYVIGLLQEVERSQKNEFVSFIMAGLLDQILSCLAGFLIAVATSRIWKILKFAFVFRLLGKTLSKAAFDLISTGCLLGIFLFIFGISVFVINSSNSEIFSNMYKVMTSLTALSLGFSEEIDLSNLMFGGKTLGIIIYFVIMSVMNIYLVNMFITLLCYHFTVVKDLMENDRKNENTLWEFVKMEVSDYFHGSKKSIKIKNFVENQSNIIELLNLQCDYIEGHLQMKPKSEKYETSTCYHALTYGLDYKQQDFCGLKYCQIEISNVDSAE